MSEVRIRLARIDAPELKGPDSAAARASRDHLRDLIEGKMLEVCVCKAWPDRYGRVLAEVHFKGENISNHMLSYGYAVPYSHRHCAPDLSVIQRLSDTELSPETAKHL